MKQQHWLIVLLIAFCAVAEAGVPASQQDGIDAEFSGTPLRSAIEVLSAISGTSISVDGRHANPPITVRLSNSSLDQALSTVLRRVSHMIIRQSDGAYSVLILEGDDAEAGEEQPTLQVRNLDANPASLGLGLGEPELFPGSNGGPGLTQQDLDYYAGTQVRRNPDKIQVIPPGDDASGAVSLAQLREKNALDGAKVAAAVADIDTIPSGEIR